MDTFSAPIDLINAVVAEAARMDLTKSGFIRYALARALGYAETDAKAMAQHGQVAALKRASAKNAAASQGAEKRAKARSRKPRPAVQSDHGKAG